MRLDGRLSSASLAVELAVAREVAETNQSFVREGQDARAEAVPFGLLRDVIGDRMALWQARIVRRQERGRDDSNRAEFGRLFRVEPTRESAAKRAPELFLLAEELAEAVDEFSSGDGADCGGQDVAAVADLVPVPVLVLVPFRSCGNLPVQLSEAPSVRRDESMGGIEPEQVEGIEAASRGGGRQRSRGRGARAEDVGPRSLVGPAVARRGKDDSKVCFAQAGNRGKRQISTWRRSHEERQAGKDARLSLEFEVAIPGFLALQERLEFERKTFRFPVFIPDTNGFSEVVATETFRSRRSDSPDHRARVRGAQLTR